MATNEEIKSLVRAHADGDDAKFRAITLALAANAENKSPTTAKTLRLLADRTSRPVQLTQLPNTLPILATKPTIQIDAMVLEPAVRDRVTVYELAAALTRRQR